MLSFTIHHKDSKWQPMISMECPMCKKTFSFYSVLPQNECKVCHKVIIDAPRIDIAAKTLAGRIEYHVHSSDS